MPRRSVVEHDALVESVRAIAARIEPAAVASAFAGSLRPRRVAHWSTLASFAIARTLPPHGFEALSGRAACRTCGAFAHVDAFESDQYAKARRAGVIRSDSLRYTLYDLESFDYEDVPVPEAADRATLAFAMSRIRSVAGGGAAFAAERAVGAVFHSRIERKAFLGALGVCGVLQSPEKPGFWPAFVPFERRAYADATPYTYPVAWWRRECGIDDDALRASGIAAFL